MENKIKNHLEGLLTAAAECDAKAEIMAELYANLLEKYNDLLAQGQTPEAAYTQVIDGIGDMDEIISFINASRPRRDFDFGGAFEGFEGRMKQLAHELEAPLREVAQDLKNAALSARDAAVHAKDPLREMARQVGQEVKNVGRSVAEVVSNIEFSQPGKNTFRYDYEVPAAGVEGLAVRAEGGSVTFGISQNDNVYVVELARQPLPEDKRACIELRDGILTLSHGKSQAGFFFFGIGVCSSDFEIYLPKKLFDTITVETSSGAVDLDYDLESRRLAVSTASGQVTGAALRCPDLRITTTSGDIRLSDLRARQIFLHSTSGDIRLSGEVLEADLSTTSGDMELSGSLRELMLKTASGDIELDGTAEGLRVQTVSGDLEARLAETPERLEIETVSGDVRLQIPENEGFTLSYKRVSGDIKSDFNLLTSINSKDGYGVYRNGDLRTFTIGTVSGDIRLLRR